MAWSCGALWRADGEAGKMTVAIERALSECGYKHTTADTPF